MKPRGKIKSMSCTFHSNAPKICLMYVQVTAYILTTLLSLFKLEINRQERLSSNKISKGLDPIYTTNSCIELCLDNLKIHLITVLKATHRLRLCSLYNTKYSIIYFRIGRHLVEIISHKPGSD